MNSPVSTRDVVVAYLAALNAGDVTAAADLVSEDFFNEHTSSSGVSSRGREAYRERLPRFLAQFTRLRYEHEDLLVDGARAAVPYTMTFGWMDDDGRVRPVRIRGVFRFRVEDGRITHRIDYWDAAEFQRQVAARVAS